MTKRRRILHADKIIQNVIQLFCLLMFLQLKGYYSVVSNPVLLYSTASDIRTLNTSRLSKVNILVKDLKQGSAVDFLYKKNMICWSDQNAELIECASYNDTHVADSVRVVSDGLITPVGIAIDWYTEKIYWTDGDTNKIEVISIEQKYRKVLFWTEVDLARAIAVAPKEGLMFWTDWGEVPKIERAGMNGDPKTRQVIVKDDIFWPNGITIDYDSNLIYWVDAHLHFVDAIEFDGKNRKRIVEKGLVYPYAITVINEKLYWTDWKTWAIHVWDMSISNGKIKDLIQSKPVPVDIKVYDSNRQHIPDGDYPCKYNNGGCSHLCLLAPTEPGYTCACPTGVKLQEGSNSTCYNGPQSMLIIAQRATISKISLDSPDFTPYTLPLKDLKRAQAVDFDSEYIYWADIVAKSISKVRLDGSEQSVVIHSNGAPDSIALDLLARNLYWTDSATDTINVARLDGTSKKVIIHEELYEPRAIAVAPSLGLVFWSDWNERRPKIERAALDGSQRAALVAERLGWPNGIALDVPANKLYWGDARTHKIEVCNMDGSQRIELHGTEIYHLFGLTLLGDYLYWTDIQKRTLDRINKNTGLDREAVVDQMPNMMGVKAFQVGASAGWNRCADTNGGCSHLCFNNPDSMICGCPLGLELISDRKTCKEPDAFLLYSRKNVIGRISIENEVSINDAVLPIKDLKEVSALAVYVPGSKVYWSDSKTKTINRCSIDGSNPEKILEWMGLVEGLAIDYTSENIYWTDTATQRIEVARLDGSNRRALIWQGLKKPKSIVLDPKRGHMYWSELGSKSIKRAGLDGAGPAVWLEQVGRVHALAVERDSRTLFWAALDPGGLHAARLDGGGRRALLDAGPMPCALAVLGPRLYWGDWNTGVIESVNKSDGSGRSRVHSGLDYISDLRVYGRGGGGGGGGAGAPCTGGGGCAHLCLPTPRGPRCACAAHHTLKADNVSCAEPEEFLLFAQKNTLGRIVVANGECTDAYIPLTGLKNVRAIDFDPVDKQLYWLEEDSHVIRRVPISSSSTSAITDSTVVVSGLCRLAYIVLDVVGRTLYWTCTDTDSINATSLLNNSVTGVVLRGDSMMPRHLAFHQTMRYLVWHDAGLGVIMRSNGDGSERAELARAHNASALTLDQAAQAVYWAVGRQIHAARLDGTDRRMVWQGGSAGSLAALGGALYCGGPERQLARLPLARREAPAQPVPHVARALALAAVLKVSPHPCSGGGACGPRAAACGRGGACLCGLGCAPPPACAPHHVPCDDSLQPKCIPDYWRCDGQHDCADGRDEAGCGECGGVRCADGSCAPALGACAAGVVCAQPLPHAFRCDERLCLAPALLCDGRRHCADGSDEAARACDPPPEPERRSWRTLSVCAGAAVCACAAGGGALLLRRWRRRARPRPLPALAHAAQLKPLHAAHHTDTSTTTDSACGRYPRPTLNPPPSPATASSGAGGAAGGAGGGGGGRRRAYRHYRAINRPPPPTPASTDACESEPEARAPPPSPAP